MRKRGFIRKSYFKSETGWTTFKLNFESERVPTTIKKIFWNGMQHNRIHM